MARLEEFLRSGALGPVMLGTSSAAVIGAVGEPLDISRTTKPLVMRYGSVELFFWRASHAPMHELRKIAIKFQPKYEVQCTELAFSDFAGPVTEDEFYAFVRHVNYLPVESIAHDGGQALVFLSGVRATFAQGFLQSIRVSTDDIRRTATRSILHEREPETSEILAMFEEANVALNAGATRAALLIAWAGLEAALRLRTFALDPAAKLRVQPWTLINRLSAAGVLSPSDHRTLEELRQLRMAAAHGLSHISVEPNKVRDILAVTHRLLELPLQSSRDTQQR